MKKIDALQKTIIANKVLSQINKIEIDAGEVVTIKIETKRNGELKTITVEKGDQV